MSWAPLDGVRIGALGSSRALRFASRTLASLGAEVTRLAPRGVDPPPLSDPLHGGASKREERLSEWLDEGVAVVATSAPDGAAVPELAASDLLLHDALVEPAAALAAGSRAVVSVSMGLDPRVPACGLTAAARASVAVAVGAPDREPLGLPFDLADYSTGLVAATAALAELALPAGGRGAASVDAVSVLATFAGVNGLVYEPYGIPWMRERRRASQCGGPYPYGFLRAEDGYVCAIGRSRSDWQRLLGAMGDPDWGHDERYSNLRRNGALYADELDELVERWTVRQTRAELLEVSRARGLALAPLRTAAEVLEDPDLAECGFLRRGAGPRPGAPVESRSEPPPGARDSGTVGRRPLEGLRVLDFGWVWSAPLVGAGLADLGADVVKVEHRGRPDNSRLRGRPEHGWIERDGGDSLESVPYFLNLNHGKRGIAVDMKDEGGAEIVRSLMREADIVIENLGEDMFRRLGVDYERAAPANPGLVWLSMPTRRCGSQDMRGYAPTISSFSGLESAVGYPGDLTGMMSFGLCDPVAGTWGLAVALAAWLERCRTGRGRLLRLGQLEGFLAILGEMLEQADREGETAPAGNTHPYFWPYGTFPTGDGRWLAVAALDASQRAALAEVVGGDPLDPQALEQRLRDHLMGRSAGEALAELRGRVAVEPCSGYREARADPELRDRGLLVEVDHPAAGAHLVYTQPWRREGAPLPVERPAPLLGEHVTEVLRDWLGVDQTEAERLARSPAMAAAVG
jgi:crotonobetainyl-CoA:carnitine CoA-transferase CaiB-like acyl-CoA transferase